MATCVALRSVHGVLVLATLLSSLFAQPGDDVQGDALDTPAADDSSRPKGVERLVIGQGPDKLAFGEAGGGNHDLDEVLFQDGKASTAFKCEGAGDQTAIEGSHVAVRRLSLWQAPDRTFFGQFGFGSEPLPDLKITDGRISSPKEDILWAALGEPLPNGTYQQIQPEEKKSEITVQYDCRQVGQAPVEMRFRVESSDGSVGSVCLRWMKQCERGWKNLEIKTGNDQLVMKDGEINPEWSKRMTTEGTHEGSTKLLISAKGIEKLRRPTATSNQKLLQVELAGPVGHADAPEVGKEPVPLIVVFVCLFEGFADITLVLEKDSFSGDEPERTEITWRKNCGETSFAHLEVSIKSEIYKNKTKAVSAGAVQKGFERPCKGAEAQELAAALGRHHVGSRCSNSPRALSISEKEIRTVLELELDKEGGLDMPGFYPQPDLTYDHKVVKVTVLQAPFLSNPNGRDRRGPHKRPRRETITVKYTCYKDGVSIVMMTLYVFSFKPIYFAWSKRCVEPKARVGKALTAPQAIMVTMFVCGIIVLLVCLIFAFGGQESAQTHEKIGYERSRAREEEDDFMEVELPAKEIGKPQEVTYH